MWATALAASPSGHDHGRASRGGSIGPCARRTKLSARTTSGTRDSRRMCARRSPRCRRCRRTSGALICRGRGVVLGVIGEGALDLLRGHPRRGGIPQRERRDAVGVDVLRRLLELREPRQARPRVGVTGRRRLGEDRSVRLDDERRVGAVGGHGTRRIGEGADTPDTNYNSEKAIEPPSLERRPHERRPRALRARHLPL